VGVEQHPQGRSDERISSWADPQPSRSGSRSEVLCFSAPGGSRTRPPQIGEVKAAVDAGDEAIEMNTFAINTVLGLRASSGARGPRWSLSNPIPPPDGGDYCVVRSRPC
jgi:hypothetical protein